MYKAKTIGTSRNNNIQLKFQTTKKVKLTSKNQKPDYNKSTTKQAHKTNLKQQNWEQKQRINEAIKLKETDQNQINLKQKKIKEVKIVPYECIHTRSLSQSPQMWSYDLHKRPAYCEAEVEIERSEEI